MGMKTVTQKITNQIEYLGALAELYKKENDQQAHQATLAAIEALRQLIEVIDCPPYGPPQSLPIAA